jgi:hypothetical protein
MSVEGEETEGISTRWRRKKDRHRKRTERNSVDLALDLDHGRLDVEDVDDVVEFSRVENDRRVVFVVFLRNERGWKGRGEEDQ